MWWNNHRNNRSNNTIHNITIIATILKGRLEDLANNKFNEEICNDLCKYRAEGLTISDCAALCGIERHTVSAWVKKGKSSKTGKHRDFYKKWVKATAKFKRLHQKKISDSEDWRASKYLLEVTDPEHYVVNDKLEVKADVNKTEDNFERFAKIIDKLTD